MGTIIAPTASPTMSVTADNIYHVPSELFAFATSSSREATELSRALTLLSSVVFSPFKMSISS